MMKLMKLLSVREIFLFGLTLSVVVLFLAAKYCLLPAYDEQKALRAQAQLMSMDYAKLLTNLAVSEKMGREYEILRDGAVVQTQSDQITLSTFLQQIEAAARRPTLMLINMKPQAVVTSETFKSYPVKLSISGNLPEVIRFVSDLLSAKTVIGVDHFMLRGVQSYGRVECSMELNMVTIIPPAARERGGG
jgi:Tfp pilus assembly protein PilO